MVAHQSGQNVEDLSGGNPFLSTISTSISTEGEYDKTSMQHQYKLSASQAKVQKKTRSNFEIQVQSRWLLSGYKGL